MTWTRPARAAAAALLAGVVAPAIPAVATPAAAPAGGAARGPAAAGPALPRAVVPWVHQAGTYDALAAGRLDGSVAAGALMAAAGGRAQGLGTVDRLDGEVVVVAGRAWRVGVDGRPQALPGTRRTPFFQVVAFRPGAARRVPAGTACSALGPLVDAAAGRGTGVVAVRVAGTFRALVTRSVPAQPAGTPLAQAVKRQKVFDLGARSATLVGFRSGADVAGLSPAGLHLHGLTADRTAGGHVLSCTVAAATLQVQRTAGVRLTAP